MTRVFSFLASTSRSKDPTQLLNLVSYLREQNHLVQDFEGEQQRQEHLYEELSDKIRDHLEQGRDICLIMHSHGAVVGKRALERRNNTDRKKVWALAYGGATLIKNDLAGYVNNCIHVEDWIAKFGDLILSLGNRSVWAHEEQTAHWDDFLEIHQKAQAGFTQDVAQIPSHLNDYSVTVVGKEEPVQGSLVQKLEKLVKQIPQDHSFLSDDYRRQLAKDLNTYLGAHALVD